eukprot:CAMPEP_0202408532 /NCGR_PEP_ID=MMETSP1128-20130828/14990_1 /ASSEMBLY_ACC=CAM_ASM_000463 /TAXON_ID=3047 /ORGANISM="Dunaliella tertiolecta, Strain CCMP1320" /LENGTH=40 /DNA_ID= /DNA_START= /DNA_END= /DNA_ORIENTATION=
MQGLFLLLQPELPALLCSCVDGVLELEPQHELQEVDRAAN